MNNKIEAFLEIKVMRRIDTIKEKGIIEIDTREIIEKMRGKINALIGEIQEREGRGIMREKELERRIENNEFFFFLC